MGIQYDPVKRSLGQVFNTTPWLRIFFYHLLDLLLLRAWYINRELRLFARKQPNAKVLDAGSGFGQYVYRMSALSTGWQVEGLDIKQEQIDDCNAFFARIPAGKRVNFAWADLTKLETKDSSYDLILSVDVMEHILEDETVFAHFSRSLKPGGMLLISTPSDQGGSDVHDHDHESFIDEHVRDGYNADDIKAKLSRAGFSRIETQYTYGKPGSVAWRLSMKYPLLMIHATKLAYLVLPFYYLLVYPWCYVLNHIDTRQSHASGTGLMVKAWK